MVPAPPHSCHQSQFSTSPLLSSWRLVSGGASSTWHLVINTSQRGSPDNLCEHPYGLWWYHDSQGINTDPCYGRATDQDVALGGSMGLDITMASGSSTGRSHQAAPHLHHVSSSASLHSAQIASLLFPSHISNMYLLAREEGQQAGPLLFNYF